MELYVCQDLVDLESNALSTWSHVNKLKNNPPTPPTPQKRRKKHKKFKYEKETLHVHIVFCVLMTSYDLSNKKYLED